MRTLIITLIVVCLSGCVTKLTLNSPEIKSELKQPCGDKIAEPLTTADQFDLARALVQSTTYARDCAARHRALIDAIEVREQVMKSVKTQMDK